MLNDVLIQLYERDLGKLKAEVELYTPLATDKHRQLPRSRAVGRQPLPRQQLGLLADRPLCDICATRGVGSDGRQRH